MSNFIPMENLDRLTAEQRQDYYIAACTHLGVPANLNLLYFRYVDQGDGPAQLMLLIKRGGAEIIRANKGISITGLKLDNDNADYISYQAIGTDKNGRQEIALGASTVKNLFGQEK